MRITTKILRKGMMAMSFLAVIGLVSCTDDNELMLSVEDTDTVEEDAIVEAAFEDLDDIVAVSMVFADTKVGTERVSDEPNDDRLTCATLEWDFENRRITIDFGDGCEGPGGRIRKGKIIISYTGPRFIRGSVITTTLEDYFISIPGTDPAQFIELRGTRTVENVSDPNLDGIRFEIKLRGATGGDDTFAEAIWPDGAIGTRRVDRTREYLNILNPFEGKVRIDGLVTGQNRRGVNYSVDIVTPLEFWRSCGREIFLPVVGVKEITHGDQLIIIDFGDGTCDNTYIVSINGNTESISL